MDGYNSLKNPTSLYNQPQEFSEVDSNDKDYKTLINDYCGLYESVINAIYVEKIRAYKDFYSFCQFDDDDVSIEKSDYLYIQSFVISTLENYMTQEISELGMDVGNTFNFDERDLEQQENIILRLSNQINEIGQDYLADNTSEFFDNFSLSKQLSKLQDALNEGKTELALFKYKFLSDKPYRTEFKMPSLRINYSNYAIKALKALASLNLVTLIGDILIEIIFTAITENQNTLAYFESLDGYIKQQSDKDDYFIKLEAEFKKGTKIMMSNLKKDLELIYDNVTKLDDAAERKLFHFQMERKYNALVGFVSRYNLKVISEDILFIDGTHTSSVLRGASLNQNQYLIEKWTYFNTGSSYDIAKNTSIFGPEKNKWRSGLRYLDKAYTVSEEVYDGRGTYEDLRVGIVNKTWVFLEQLLHEGLKFGIDFLALQKKKTLYKNAMLKKISEQIEPVQMSLDLYNRKQRDIIIQNTIDKYFYFDKNELFSRNQTKSYFKTCEGNVRNINPKNIYRVGIKILDLNDDDTNDLVLLDSIEFQIFYYKNGSSDKESEITREWISYG